METEDGRELASAEPPFTPEAAVASVVGYLGPQPPSPPLQAASGGRRAVARVREEDLPEQAAAYASLDLLVVEELDERRLNNAQREALLGWLLHGGRVVVTGLLDPQGPLSGWLQAARYTGRSVDAGRLRSLSADRLTELEPVQGGSPVVEGGRTVAVALRRGLGTVYAWAGGADHAPPNSPLWYLALREPQVREAPPEPDGKLRTPFGPAAAALGAYAALWVAAVAAAGRARWGWLVPVALTGCAAAAMPLVAEEVRQRAASLETRWVEVTVEGVARAFGWADVRAPYPGTYAYVLPRVEALSARGAFSEAEVTFLPEATRVAVRQGEGQQVRLYWEGSGQGAVPAVDVRGGEVVVRGGGVSEGVAFWRGHQAPLEGTQEAQEWVAARWDKLDSAHPAWVWLRWALPAAATIVEDRPVVALRRGDGAQGWLVVVGPRR